MINYHSDSSISVHKWKDLQKVLSCSQSSASSRLSPAGRTRYSGDSVLELSCRHNMAPENAELLYSVYNDMRDWTSVQVNVYIKYNDLATALYCSAHILYIPESMRMSRVKIRKALKVWRSSESPFKIFQSMTSDIQYNVHGNLHAERNSYLPGCGSWCLSLHESLCPGSSVVGYHILIQRIHWSPLYTYIHYITFTLHLHYIHTYI